MGSLFKKPVIWQTAYDRKMVERVLMASFAALLIGLHEYLMISRWNWIMCFRRWHGVKWPGSCLYDHMHTVCVRLTACFHIHVSASATYIICTCLLLCTLSDYCCPQCWRECNNGSSREDCVPWAGGSGCLLPLLKRKLLSALWRNKSFIWFVVFLTKGSWSRNKALLSIPSAPILSLLLSPPQHTLPYTDMQGETRSHFCWPFFYRNKLFQHLCAVIDKKSKKHYVY